MNDLRTLLEHAAGDSPAPASLDAVRRRAAALTCRRHVGALAALAAAATLVAVTATQFPDHRALPANTPTLERGRLVPGTYAARVLGQDLTVTVPEGLRWTAIRVEASGLALLEEPDLVQVKVLRWTAVHRYTTQGAALPATDPLPVDLMSWLAHRPGVHPAGPPTATTLAGQPAHRIRITMDDSYNVPAGPAAGCSSSPALCIVLADSTEGVITLTSNSDLTLTAQDRTDDLRLVAVALNLTNADVPTPDIR